MRGGGGGGEVCLRDVCGAVVAMGVFWLQFILVGGGAKLRSGRWRLAWGEAPLLCVFGRVTTVCE